MPTELKTDWKRIGRSGPTVDGRTIEPESIRQAAESYDPELFTALMWPEHFRWYNLGKITALRAEDNDEGGVDLFALIAPNDYYLEAVKFGQKLFTSMELLPNFRNTGEVYLTGCAATDNPASAATSEMRFSASKDNDLSLGQHIELTSHHFSGDESITDESTLLKRIANLFNKNSEDDMSKQALEDLKTELTALSDKFAALDKKPETPTADGDKDNFASMEATVTALAERFTALEAKLESGGDDDAGDAGEGNAADIQFTALQTALDDLTAKFTAALGEQEGTDAGVNDGTDDDSSQYI